MERKTKLVITFIILVLLVIALYAFTNWFSVITGYVTGGEENTKLADCLNSKNAEFYSSDYCEDCQRQKTEFGSSFRVIQTVNCGDEKEICPNIRELPAWYIDGKIHYGFKTADELKEVSGCKD